MNDFNQKSHHDDESQDNNGAKKGEKEIQKSINRFFENAKEKFQDTLDNITRMMRGQ